MTMATTTEKLQSFPWFMGFATKRYLQKFLTNPGDWCVRGSTTKGIVEFAICALGEDNQIHDVKIRERQSKSGYVWSVHKDITSTKFATVVDLIQFLRDGDHNKIRLKTPIQRPKTFIKAGSLECQPNQVLGQGQYGIVLRGTYTKGDKKHDVAVKIPKPVDIRNVSSRDVDKLIRDAQMQIDEMMKEADLMIDLKHANILRCFGIDCTDPNVKLVLALCPGGSLLSHLRANPDDVLYEEKVIFLLEASRGFKYLHQNQILHRDISARNCLIGRYGQILISDFGLSIKLEEKWEDSKDLKVPIAWLAPECLNKRPRYSIKSDVFAFAIMAYEILHDGEQPWPELGDTDEIIKRVRTGERMVLSSKVPKDLADLVKISWAQPPYTRPDFTEITSNLRKIADKLQLPIPEKRSVAKLHNVRVRPFKLDDPTDFEVDELSPPPTSRELQKINVQLKLRATMKQKDDLSTTKRTNLVLNKRTDPSTSTNASSNPTTNANSTDSTTTRGKTRGKLGDSLLIKPDLKLVPSPIHKSTKQRSLKQSAKLMLNEQSKLVSRTRRQSTQPVESSTTARRRYPSRATKPK
ncbi:hypothetical protein M3Y98_00901800 [Aphelenchoides besseyi]|nr:hypothetical protein M3Y98_00901800 [Aphelenchoides besseyi]KAI6193613.1 hypothetical protein M3Y96_01037300 [Aphelenchoides besseyi]